MAPRSLIIALACLVPLLSPASADGAADKFGGLLANSPFGLSRPGVAGSGAAEPLEFRAVLEENGNRIFSIYDTATRQSTWVDLNDPVKDFSVKEFDAEHTSVTVEYQGKPLKLALKRAPAVVAALPVPTPGSPAVPINRNVQVAQTTVPPQQLQQIRDEINRRRALRAQPVATSGAAGPAPAPQPAAQPPPANRP